MVVPAATPITTPVEDTRAILVSAELQMPPVTESANVVDVPRQMVSIPVMDPVAGSGVTVTKAVAIPVPQPLVTE